ncbi:MAG: Gfo/Idh/MocA family oxidoreductase [Gemmataceae bacterium]
MTTPLDRRKFFGTAAALSLPASSYAAVAGSNDRVRVGFLGCGGRAQAHIDLVTRFAREGKGVAPAAVCDVWDGLDDEYDVAFGGKTTRRKYSQGLYPSARKCGLDPADAGRVTKDYRRVLDRADVDVVVVATPDHWHGKMTADALHAGKDVLVEAPFVRRAEEAVAVVDAWRHSGRVVTVGVQGMADAVWVRAFDAIRTGTLGHVGHAQTGTFRNDARGQWRYYRLAREMTPRTIDWDRFLGHRVEFAGRPLGPSPKELAFDRAAFAQWRCVRELSGGPLSDLLCHPLTHMVAALGVREPARVTAGGGIFLETDGRSVPDVATVVADFDEGLQLVATAATVSGFPADELVRGRLGALRFVRGGFQLYRDDPHRGASYVPRSARPPEPTSVVAVEPPRNETEALWENFLECVRARRQSTFCPPDLAAVGATVCAMAEASVWGGNAPVFWDRERREVATGSDWADRWVKRSAARTPPGTIAGWSGGDAGRTLTPPTDQKLAGLWKNGRDPAG